MGAQKQNWLYLDLCLEEVNVSNPEREALWLDLNCYEGWFKWAVGVTNKKLKPSPTTASRNGHDMVFRMLAGEQDYLGLDEKDKPPNHRWPKTRGKCLYGYSDIHYEVSRMRRRNKTKKHVPLNMMLNPNSQEKGSQLYIYKDLKIYADNFSSHLNIQHIYTHTCVAMKLCVFLSLLPEYI